jgi:hypothetical protein
MFSERMKTQRTSKNYLQTLSIITYAQIANLIMFSVLVYFLKQNGVVSDDHGLAHIFLYIVPAFVVASMSAGYFAFGAMINKIGSTLALNEKLKQYQTAFIVRMALLEVSGLLGAVAAVLSGELYFLAAPLMITIVIFLLRPAVFTIVEELRLSSAEREALQNPDTVIN